MDNLGERISFAATLCTGILANDNNFKKNQIDKYAELATAVSNKLFDSIHDDLSGIALNTFQTLISTVKNPRFSDINRMVDNTIEILDSIVKQAVNNENDSKK